MTCCGMGSTRCVWRCVWGSGVRSHNSQSVNLGGQAVHTAYRLADAGGYHATSAKCALRAACHSCGVYRIPNIDVEAKAVYTNNPNGGAMRGFGSNPARFALEGVMDMLAERVGVDG